MMLTAYQQDLFAQPQALRDTCTGFAEQQAVINQVARTLQGGTYRRVVLTGMGSSFYALYPLQLAWTQLGFAPHWVETAELLYAQNGLLRADTLVVAVSQSGASAEMLRLVERKAAQNFTLLAITNMGNSPLARGADMVLQIRAGKETSVSCKTYLASLLAVSLLAAAPTQDGIAARLTELQSAADGVQLYLNDYPAHLADLKERIASVNDFFLVGRGASLASAETGALILKEAAHIHAEGMSSAAFRHGPLEMAAQDVFLVTFEGTAALAGLNRGLLETVRRAGGRGALISAESEGAFRLPAHFPESLLPIFEILPIQAMTIALADLHGREAGRFAHATKITNVE